MVDYYKILKLSYSASDSEIKKQFRILAKLYHPDKNGGSEGYTEIFKALLEAYEVLSDKSSRLKYDEKLQIFLAGSKKSSSSNSKKERHFGKDTTTAGQGQKKTEVRKTIFPLYDKFFWIISGIIVFSLIYNLLYKTTSTGNKKADHELEKQKVENRPESGEIDFNKVK